MKKIDIGMTEEFEKDFYKISYLENTKNLKLKYFYEKLKKDKYYFKLYKSKKSIKLLYTSGFFIDTVDNVENEYYENIFTTPFNKLSLKKGKINHIVLTSGGFAPFHNGHLDLIDKSIEYLLNKNKHVAGAYVSPSHDDYVLKKPKQLEIMTSNYRINELNKQIINHKYLMCDIWEANVVSSSVNFTQVIYRLEKYLKYHFSNYKFKIIYCYGADNFNFKNVFEVNKLESICLNRNNYFSNLNKEQNKYTILINHQNDISSTILREEFVDIIESKILYKYNQNYKYYIRNDSEILFSQDYGKEFKKIIKKYIKTKIQIKSTKDEKVLKSKNEKIISLDTYYKGDYNLEYSRKFNLCDNQFSTKKIIDRPGFINDLNSIKKGTYTLLDDDISSEKTIKEVIKKLPKKIKINKIKTIISKKTLDVIDFRDFILGVSDNGGLVVEMPNKKLLRTPYIFPYVSTHSRALIPINKEKEFTLDILDFNLKVLKNKKLKDMNHMFIEFMSYQGFKKNDDMSDIIKIFKKMIVKEKK